MNEADLRFRGYNVDIYFIRGDRQEKPILGAGFSTQQRPAYLPKRLLNTPMPNIAPIDKEIVFSVVGRRFLGNQQEPLYREKGRLFIHRQEITF
jgi:hypothetical protein